ncbi:unnamed protein product [Dibothriocephalus latus]|uniref:EF-hand domain-containing protein n=1 Tax=Dibothriocephalus latus TaxID=60516 RepID=A0A3P6VAG6_DIBLA|nr:unnamed protein product [Dibothriocephalus latus]
MRRNSSRSGRKMPPKQDALPDSNPITQIKIEFSSKQRKELRQAFDLLDVQGKGSIDIADIQLPLRALGFQPSREELRVLCSKYDPDKKGAIDFSGFLALLSNKMLEDDTKDELVRAFRLFDIKDRGCITFQNLKKITKTLDEDLHDEEVQVKVLLICPNSVSLGRKGRAISKLEIDSQKDLQLSLLIKHIFYSPH